MTRFIKTFLALTLCAGTLAACNTVGGAGKDIERAGETVQDAAD
jgi:entericidin A